MHNATAQAKPLNSESSSSQDPCNFTVTDAQGAEIWSLLLGASQRILETKAPASIKAAVT